MQPSKSFSEEGIDRLFAAFRKMRSISTVPDSIVTGRNLLHQTLLITFHEFDKNLSLKKPFLKPLQLE